MRDGIGCGAYSIFVALSRVVRCVQMAGGSGKTDRVPVGKHVKDGTLVRFVPNVCKASILEKC